jgi:hypothetical protein
MANLAETSAWESGIYQIETTDPVVGGADGISNVQAKQLANRTKYLYDALDELQALAEGIDEEAQNALAVALAWALDAAGLAHREIEGQRFTRHQQGVVVVYNRGVKSGCEVSRSSTATRNLNLAAGVAFSFGREWGVAGQVNGASVPGNPGTAAGVCQVYLNRNMDLSCTLLDEPAPADALVLYAVTVPAGNTDDTDPYLADCTLTAIVRREPAWPAVQAGAAYEDVTLARKLGDDDYVLALEVLDYAGGEPPRLAAPAAQRATNAFRVYSDGSADAVTVRWSVHRMAY